MAWMHGDGAMAGDATAPDDYDRACAVDDLAGVITVGDNGAQALVLADEPATSCYLPERGAFLRWLAADSEAGLKAAAEAVLADPATEWEEWGTWTSDGPAVLMDSAEAGAELNTEYPGGGMPSQSPVRCGLRRESRTSWRAPGAGATVVSLARQSDRRAIWATSRTVSERSLTSGEGSSMG